MKKDQSYSQPYNFADFQESKNACSGSKSHPTVLRTVICDVFQLYRTNVFHSGGKSLFESWSFKDNGYYLCIALAKEVNVEKKAIGGSIIIVNMIHGTV